MRQYPPNVRFWVWINDGWVNLHLNPGQTLSCRGGNLTDEGYSYWYEEWEYDKDALVVVRRDSSRFRDCDGPGERYSESQCEISELMMDEPHPQTASAGVRVPNWKRLYSTGRDIFAEAMGY